MKSNLNKLIIMSQNQANDHEAFKNNQANHIILRK